MTERITGRPGWLPDRKAKQSVNAARGLLCPTCGTTSIQVVDSRPAAGRIRRARVCVDGHRFTTHEMIADDQGPPIWQELWRNLTVEDRAMLLRLAKRLTPGTDTTEEG